MPVTRRHPGETPCETQEESMFQIKNRAMRRAFAIAAILPIFAMVMNCGEAKNIEDTLVQGNEFILSTIPSNGFAAHSRDRAIVVGFTRDMDPASITAPGVIVVTDSTGAAVAGAVTYHNIGKAAVFMPSAGMFASGETHTVTVDGTITDLQGNSMGAPYSFTFTTFVQNSAKLAADTTMPSIIFRYPVNGSSSVTTTTGISITFDEPIHPGSLTSSSVVLTDGVNTVPAVITYIVPAHSLMVFPEIMLRNNTLYTIEINGGLSDTAIKAPNVLQPVAPATTVASWSFTTELDQIPPEVYNTSPINGSNGVSLDASISVTFSEEIDTTSLNPANFEIFNVTANAAVTGTYQFDLLSKTATFIPSGGLFDASSEFKITLNSGIVDLSGNGLVNPVVFSFVSGNQLDTTPPTVASTSPADGAVNINLNANITINFSEPMSPGSINGNSVFLTLTSSTDPSVPAAEIGTNVAGNVFYNGSNNSAVFMPGADLYPNTNYTLSVTAAVADLAGKAMLGDYIMAFQTGAQSDLTGPLVVQTTPANAQVNVAYGTAITATFDEELNASTVVTANITLSDGAVNIPGGVSHLFDGANSIVTFTPDNPADLVYGKIYTVTLSELIKDLAGNPMNADFRWAFSMEPPMPPAIAMVTPANGTTTVANGDPISVVFDREMNPATINASNITLDNGIFQVAAQISYSIDFSNPSNPVGIATIIPDPTSPLQAGLIYTVTVSGFVADLYGVALGADYRWSFSVKQEPGPQVLSVTPLNGDSNFNVNGTISAVVSGEIDIALMAGVFTLTDGVTNYNGSLAATYDPVNNNTTLNFVPFASFPLVEGKLYTATITTALIDLAGNNMLSDYSWSFYIPAPTAGTLIASTLPANNASNVPLSSQISIALNSPLDATTIKNLQNMVTVEYGAFTMLTKEILLKEQLKLAEPLSIAKDGTKLVEQQLITIGSSPGDIIGKTSETMVQVYAAVTYDMLTDTILIDAGPLASYSLYRVTLNSGLTDISGNTTAVDSVFSFTTEMRYSILVSVFGLTSPNSLVVQNTYDASTLTFNASGSAYMPNTYSGSLMYKVIIDAGATNLSSPVQSCAISGLYNYMYTNGYVHVQVSCYTIPFYVSGNISGVNGGAVALSLNGGQPLNLTTDGPFQFPYPLPDHSFYSVALVSQDLGRQCTVYNDKGQILGANVTNIDVQCTPAMQYPVSVTVNGFSNIPLPASESLVVQVNGGETLMVPNNGYYLLNSSFPEGSTVSLSIIQQPAAYSCTIAAPNPQTAWGPEIWLTVNCTSNQLGTFYRKFGSALGSYFADVTKSNGSTMYVLGYDITTMGMRCMTVQRLKAATFHIDTTFDPSGSGTYRYEHCVLDFENIRPVSIVRDRSGGVVFGGVVSANGVENSYIYKLDVNGNLISTFGQGTYQRVNYAISDIAVDMQNNIIVTGVSKVISPSNPWTPLVGRLTSSGQIDANFGGPEMPGHVLLTNSYSTIYNNPTPVAIETEMFTTQGYYVVAKAADYSSNDAHTDTVVMRIHNNGQVDTTFFNGVGSVTITYASPSGMMITGGGFMVYGNKTNGAIGGFISNFRGDGSPDILFGVNGMKTYPGYSIYDLLYDANGNLIGLTSYNNTTSAFMGINGGSGAVNLSFGVNGLKVFNQVAGYNFYTQKMALSGSYVVAVGSMSDLSLKLKFLWGTPPY